MQMTLKEYATHLSTFYVYGCVVRDRTRFGFIADRWAGLATKKSRQRKKADEAGIVAISTW